MARYTSAAVRKGRGGCICDHTGAMMFCCRPMDTAIEEAGRKGISVIAHNQDGIRFFCIQGRACDYADEEKLKGLRGRPEIPRFLRVVSQWAIRFCPFCGMKLDSEIMKNLEHFDA